MYSVFPKGSKGGYTGTLPLPLPLWGLDLVFLGARLKNGIEGKSSKKAASKNGRSKNPVPNPNPVLPINPVENCLFCLEPRKWSINTYLLLLLSNQIFWILTPQKQVFSFLSKIWRFSKILGKWPAHCMVSRISNAKFWKFTNFLTNQNENWFFICCCLFLQNNLIRFRKFKKKNHDWKFEKTVWWATKWQ